MGKQFAKLCLALFPQRGHAEEVRLTESRVKETKFYSLFRRSHLFNGKICLHYFACYSLYIRCKITLSKLWYEVPFEYCVLKIIKGHPSLSPHLRSYYPQGREMSVKRDITKLYPLPASGPCLLSAPREAHYAFPTISLLRIATMICSAEITS